MQYKYDTCTDWQDIYICYLDKSEGDWHINIIIRKAVVLIYNKNIICCNKKKRELNWIHEQTWNTNC